MCRHCRHLLAVVKEKVVLLVWLHHLFQVILVGDLLLVIFHLELHTRRLLSSLRLLASWLRPLAKLVYVRHVLRAILLIDEICTSFREDGLIDEFIWLLWATLRGLTNTVFVGLIRFGMHVVQLLIFFKEVRILCASVRCLLFVGRWLD